MTEVSDDTLETLRNLAEQQQHLQQQQQLVLKTVLAEHGLDPPNPRGRFAGGS